MFVANLLKGNGQLVSSKYARVKSKAYTKYHRVQSSTISHYISLRNLALNRYSSFQNKLFCKYRNLQYKVISKFNYQRQKMHTLITLSEKNDSESSSAMKNALNTSITNELRVAISTALDPDTYPKQHSEQISKQGESLSKHRKYSYLNNIVQDDIYNNSNNFQISKDKDFAIKKIIVINGEIKQKQYLNKNGQTIFINI